MDVDAVVAVTAIIIIIMISIITDYNYSLLFSHFTLDLVFFVDNK